ncbi:MAG: OmpH family outer membrane protein [Tabrizicola sp.]|jgi:Skp family chaperone for outer membrane proteins|nr:OmpH family outer membrane protein [Tabrizicola sp.]
MAWAARAFRQGWMRLAHIVCVAALGSLLAGAVLSQEPVPTPDLPQGAVVLVLDQDRLFAESQFGRASLERQQEAAEALEAENSRIEAELAAEEQDLTDKRPQLAAEEFSALARAFDEKVEQIRTDQDAKVRALVDARDADRRTFLSTLLPPVMAEILDTTGAVAILNKADVLVSARAIDVTDEAIARVDRRWAELDPAKTAP